MIQYMKEFDFDSVVCRRGSGSYKWDSSTDSEVIPMWVADMDFKTAPCVIEALQRRVSHGVFGYTRVSDAYYESVCHWFEQEHGWHINREHIIYTIGVVPAVSAIIKAMTAKGDKVIVQTPAFDCFFSSVRNDECQFVSNPLLQNADGSYSIDFELLSRQAADPDAKVLLLCNPHNPSGRCWTREELERVGKICLDNGVFVISDEIHCELTFNGHQYTPFASISEEFSRNCAVCISPSKAFNIAGLQIANIVAEDDETRRRIDKAINVNEVCDVNPFGVVATIAAYNEGKPWLEALKLYLWENYKYLCGRMEAEAPHYRITPLEATYLAWMDIRSSGLTSEEFYSGLLEHGKVWLNPGTKYGSEGEGFVRINLATPRTILAEAVDRLLNFIKSL